MIYNRPTDEGGREEERDSPASIVVGGGGNIFQNPLLLVCNVIELEEEEQGDVK